MKNLKNIISTLVMSLMLMLSLNVDAQKNTSTSLDDIIRLIKEGSPTFPGAIEFQNRSNDSFEGKEAADLFITNFKNSLTAVHNAKDKRKALEVHSLGKSKLEYSNLDEYVRNNKKDAFASELNLIINNSTSAEDFNNKLSDLSKRDLKGRDKQLVYIMVNIMDILEQHNSTYRSSSQVKCSGWWSCWGQCVAGTIGGAVTGAATLGIAGAAVGTVTVPVVGTVALGAVGTIAGGIGGALTGAAASC
ncbi:hypothetical protein [uncultured Winogradskyella sp.]|uniref:hypothetical protein n=1 Tax=uncultured Winogradskyella sp. TaxID=395353 RepID=UPI00261DCB5C|nr:hypothetical protein [uncultured Winogradskyella sp.]